MYRQTTNNKLCNDCISKSKSYAMSAYLVKQVMQWLHIKLCNECILSYAMSAYKDNRVDRRKIKGGGCGGGNTPPPTTKE